MANSKFLHEEIYRGKDSIAKLATKRLTVCGAGAIGSNLTENLLRIGFVSIKVIDFDRVTIQNIGTQTYGLNDVGALKVDALKNKMFRYIGVEIAGINKKLESGNVKSLLKDSDLVIDAFDNQESRLLVQTECRARKINCLHCGLFEDFGQVSFDEVYKVPQNVEGDVCDYPLARNIVLLTAIVASEEILDFFLAATPRRKSWSITMRDLQIREMA